MSSNAHSNLLEDYHLLSYDSLDSTNEEAKRLAYGGGSHGAVIWAKRQTAGRGRMGREWVSSEGNLYVTVLLNLDNNLEELSQLSFVAAVAACDTLEAIVPSPKEIRCKWPNDLLFKGHKLGGILLESFVTPSEDGQNKRWIAVGVGINIDSFPEHVMYPATCLREAGVEIISAKIVLSRFIFHFIHHFDLWQEKGFSVIQDSWLKRAYHLGKSIDVMMGDESVSGVFETIDNSGRLIIKDSGGKRKIISAGDVFFEKADA